MKIGKFFSLVVIVLGLIIPNLSYSLELFDDFSGASIDKSKWKWGENVREIRDFGGEKKLYMAAASMSPLNLSSYSDVRQYNMPFNDPNSVDSFRADVAVLERTIVGSAGTRARLEGIWYNDGTPGGGYTGDIWAEIDIRSTGSGVAGWWYVGRYTGSDSGSLSQLGSGYFTTPVAVGTTYTLYIAYDGAQSFTFRITPVGAGPEQATFSTGLPRIGYPNMPYRSLNLRTNMDNSAASCFTSATFDNIYKNETLYDDFPSLTIDASKWGAYEFVREISGGQLRTKFRSSTASTPTSDTLDIFNPFAIRTLQAKVTPTLYQNSQGAQVHSRIAGYFYNDGTSGGGVSGEVFAQVSIGGTGTNPVAGWLITRKIDSAGNEEVLSSGTFNKAISPGDTYTLLLDWSGTNFTFAIDNEVADYTPSTSIFKSKTAFKSVGTRMWQNTGKEATAEALFDDVMVSYVVPNDDFSGTYIDETKWKDGELVREIDPVSHRLILKYASPNPIGITSFPYATSNNLLFANPNSVSSIQADVTLLSYDLRNNAYTRARIAGRWYNDGSGTPDIDMTGDIWAGVELREDPSGLYAQWSVYRYTNASGSSGTTLDWGNFAIPITVGTPYTLYLGYDQGTNQFVFRVNSEEHPGPSGLPARERDPNSPWKGLSARVQINDDSSYGYLSAAFDNILKDGAVYDNFSSSTIDSTKWTSYEVATEISSGKLRSKLRTSSTSTAAIITSNLNFLYPTQIHSIKAKVTPTLFQNSQGKDVVARIWKNVYHDDTPGTGYTGDIGGLVGIGGTGTNPEAQWLVYRYTDNTGQNWEALASGTFSKTIVLGNTYNLFLAWNGSQFTFRFDDEEAHYTPSGIINPVNIPGGSIGVRVKDPAGEEAMIEALFDDVMVTVPLYLYVSKDGLCSGNNPCFPNIQNGIVSASAPSLIEITQETYNENIILNFDEAITLEGGWDMNFTSCSSYTPIQGSITITNGTMIIKNIILK